MTAAERETDLLTLEELTERVGMSVRNVRFYTSRGLVPPPIRMGRSGYYTEEHVARLGLIQELQSHGFTLAAIERYVAHLPADASPETIALHRDLLAPRIEPSEQITREDLERRAGRALSDEDVSLLGVLGAVTDTADGLFLVSGTQLTIALGLMQIGFPVGAALRTKEVYARHGRQIAEELTDIFREEVRPVLQDSGVDHDTLREMLQRINVMSIAALVASYEDAVDELRRASARRRTEG